MPTTIVPEDPRRISEDELERLAGAWEEFIAAVRRARTRGREREEGLSLSQYEFVRPLISADGLPISRLSERSGISAATATQIVDGLERARIIARSRSPQDRRTVIISLTPEGRQQVERKRRNLATQRRRFFQNFAPEERAQTERVLHHLAEVIGRV
jgi:DNA-binding MarR family transcriptional regulator